VLPRFVNEGKKYATIAIGCTGGRHRSVYLVERLASHLSSRLAAMHAAGESGLDWRQTVTHRELNSGDTGQPAGQPVGQVDQPGGQREDLSGELTPGVRDAALDQADGDGQKTTPIQAQEA